MYFILGGYRLGIICGSERRFGSRVEAGDRQSRCYIRIFLLLWDFTLVYSNRSE